ncbi:hypothetical protein RM190_04930 [Paracoccus sp. CPCC 101403]|uniref:Exo-alpha-sialidase n=1 Tax=Paracoccus broussonetiae TaxID=3075834 RepID=A0ABU3EAD9_9RHOB|nr:hypothetical protein [Paracoccus sp. CPCC 101403]MDT1061193.1 hypothetical protein [Paracoccus sp. CPCC 101403]
MMIEIVGQSGQDADNVTANPSRLVNVYAEKTTDGERILKSVLGMDRLTQLDGVFIRAMGQVDGVTYAVCGGRLWRVNADGSADDLGAVDTGRASIAGNDGKVTIQAGTRYFVYDGSTITEPNPAGEFTAFGSVEFVGNYTVLTEAGGRLFRWSELADPETLPALNFSDADSHDDKILRAFALDGRLLLFKERSTETWWVTGEAGAAAFERVAGGVRDTGLKARDLICRFPGGAFMVGSDNRATLIAGGNYQPVSTPPVETAIKLKEPLACLAYEDEGHTLLCIIFRDTAAWCYDLAMGEWHERAEGVNLGPWNVANSCKMGDDWLVGRNNGEISVLRRQNTDGETPLVREITTRTLRMDGNRTILREFELFPQRGHSAGTMDLHISRDGGANWTPPKPRKIGQTGVFGQRCQWRNLGQARQVTAKIRWSDIADIALSTQGRVVI